MQKRLPCFLLLVSLLPLPAIAETSNLQPGKWEITMSNEIKGEQPTTFTMSQCMTKRELESQAGLSTAQDGELEGKDGDCTYKSTPQAGAVIMETTCGKETTRTTITHTATTFSLKSVTTGGEAGITSAMEGKRAGDC